MFRLPVILNQVEDASAVVNQAKVDGAVELPKNEAKVQSLHVTL